MNDRAMREFRKWITENPIVALDLEDDLDGAYLKLVKIKDGKKEDEAFIIQIQTKKVSKTKH